MMFSLSIGKSIDRIYSSLLQVQNVELCIAKRHICQKSDK